MSMEADLVEGLLLLPLSSAILRLAFGVPFTPLVFTALSILAVVPLNYLIKADPVMALEFVPLAYIFSGVFWVQIGIGQPVGMAVLVGLAAIAALYMFGPSLASQDIAYIKKQMHSSCAKTGGSKCAQ